MKVKKLITRFDFQERNREEVGLGPKTRLHPKKGLLCLTGPNWGAPYPTDEDLWIKTRLVNPESCIRWVGFQSDQTNYKDGLGNTVTFVGFRLSDGNDELFWNGSEWTIAAPGNWNTEQEVADHISDYPHRALQVVINLRTTHPTFTPEVHNVKLLWDSIIEYQEDYVARSLLRAMKEEIRPIAQIIADTPKTTSAFNLSSIETTYKIVGVDGVFNLDDDPLMRNDLAGIYDASQSIIQFSASIPASKRVLIRFEYVPTIAISTHQEYIEVSQTPSIIIEGIDWNVKERIEKGEFVVNRQAGTAYELQNFWKGDIDINISWIADKLKDIDAIGTELNKFFNNKMLRSVGLDTFFRLYAFEPYVQNVGALQSSLHIARLRARICDAVFYGPGAVPVPVTKRFLAEGMVNFQVP